MKKREQIVDMEVASLRAQRDELEKDRDMWRAECESLRPRAWAATLIAAAPTLARALCRVEWNVWGDCDLLCPCCYAPRLRGHAPTCYLDAALTAAGLTAEDREEVRRG